MANPAFTINSLSPGGACAHLKEPVISGLNSISQSVKLVNRKTGFYSASCRRFQSVLLLCRISLLVIAYQNLLFLIKRARIVLTFHTALRIIKPRRFDRPLRHHPSDKDASEKSDFSCPETQPQSGSESCRRARPLLPSSLSPG